jgi:hypothetical protein
MFPFTTALLVFVWILILRSIQQEDSPVYDQRTRKKGSPVYDQRTRKKGS